MYLRKATYLVGEHKAPYWKKAEAAGVEAMRKYWSDKLGVPDVTKLPDYKPEGEWEKKWDDPTGRAGHRVWYRFDTSEAQAKAKFAGHLIWHDPDYGGGTLMRMMENAVPNNRSLLGTSERLRVGIINPGTRFANS
jgi:hypothetical protein